MASIESIATMKPHVNQYLGLLVVPLLVAPQNVGQREKALLLTILDLPY